MTKLSFHGAAGTVTGSCFLLQSPSGKTLIDCGLFQGSNDLELLNSRPFSFEASELTTILLTHAHLDHCGRLGILIKNGFRGSIYMTEATKALLEIGLMDAAHIMESKEGEHVLYTKDDVQQLLTQVKIIKLHESFEIPDFNVLYVNAGHILGSASIVLTRLSDGKRFVFSGDLGNSPQEIIQPTEYIESGDVVIIETTYGDRLHPQEDATEIIRKEINAIEHNRGTLLIPSFSIERTQEILHRIDHLKKDGKIKDKTKVFLDSPMAISTTQVFREFKNLYNSELISHTRHDDPFSFNGLHVVYHSKESERLEQIHEPKVIIAGSGMMNGGRIVSHAKTFLPIPTNRLLFVGYQGEGTLGRQIMDGEKDVKIADEHIQIRANVNATHALSSHADQKGLLKWFEKIKGVQKVFLIHGEDEPRNIFSELISRNSKATIEKPYIEDIFEV